MVADYAYDAVGNRISVIINGTTTTATFNAADQLTSRAGSATPTTPTATRRPGGEQWAENHAKGDGGQTIGAMTPGQNERSSVMVSRLHQRNGYSLLLGLQSSCCS